VDAIVDQLLQWRENYHVSYWVLQQRIMEVFAPVIAKLDGK
jgi:hypothetical protein